MNVPHASSRIGALAALGLALSLVAASSTAQAQERAPREGAIDSPANRVPYVVRPITAALRHLNLYLGLGLENVDYYRNDPAVGHSVLGVGAHFDVAYGVTDFFEIGGGVGARYTDDVRDLGRVNPERAGRVNREWLPTGLELARRPYVLGAENITNPYVRGRIALLNRQPVYVGIDLALVAPIAPRSCFSTDLGVPVHIVLARRVRIETGVFHEFVWCEVPTEQPGLATRYWSLQVPLRVMVNITPEFWIGLRSGFETVGYSLDSTRFAIPLGIQSGVRLLPRLDLLFHVVAPEFVHTDPTTNRNV